MPSYNRQRQTLAPRQRTQPLPGCPLQIVPEPPVPPAFPLLTIDVGNTHTDVALFEGTTLTSRWRWPTQADAQAAQLERDWTQQIPDRQPGSLPAVLSTVVPALAAPYTSWWPGLHLVTPADGDWGFVVAVPDPGQIGTDRLAACAGAVSLTGAPVIVLDSGTAATLSVIDAQGRFIGGAILPGLHTSLQGLVHAAPRLPAPDLHGPVDALGQTTVEAVRFGTVRGHAGAMQAMIAAAHDHVGAAPVIATGGSMGLVASWITGIDHVVPDLVLRGLAAVGRRRLGHG
jgi:type III pantothenate kinase